MIKNISFVSKIMFIISFAFIILFGAIYYVVTQNYKTILLTEQTKKINILLNTIYPTVQINLEFKIIENINISFSQLIKSNHEIKAIKLIDLKNDIITKEVHTNNYKNIIVRTKSVKDKITKETIAYLKIAYSNTSYLNAMKEFQNMFIYIGIGFFIFLISFMKFLLYMFRPLSNISYELQKYNPKDNRTLSLKQQTTTDEFSIINNVIVDMLNQIEIHTSTLEDMVDQEVEKNIIKEMQLLEQSKMAQMGEMIGNIAHQWRQPLSVISTIASGIDMKYEYNILNQEDIPKDMKLIEKHTKYLSETIDTFRNFIKEKKELKEVIIQEKIDKALYIVDATLKDYDITVKKNINYDDPIKLTLVVGELSQVIINILNNAKDALLENNIENKWVKLDLEENEKEIIISISDNAGGIAENILPKIFNPYFTTKHESQGTGLGLHMSYRIITESLKGTLVAKNTKNGAIFIIKLPKKIKA